jgi:hypothetical protein
VYAYGVFWKADELILFLQYEARMKALKPGSVFVLPSVVVWGWFLPHSFHWARSESVREDCQKPFSRVKMARDVTCREELGLAGVTRALTISP